MQNRKPEYTFDVDGHTIVTPGTAPKKKRASTPAWLDQALNEGDGVYRP